MLESLLSHSGVDPEDLLLSHFPVILGCRAFQAGIHFTTLDQCSVCKDPEHEFHSATKANPTNLFADAQQTAYASICPKANLPKNWNTFFKTQCYTVCNYFRPRLRCHLSSHVGFWLLGLYASPGQHYIPEIWKSYNVWWGRFRLHQNVIGEFALWLGGPVT